MVLSISKIGNYINHLAVKLNKNYHKHTAYYQTFECIRKFKHHSNTINSKTSTALEIGTGYSLISAIVLHLIGFKQVVTVDITKDVTLKSLKKQLQFLQHNELLTAISHVSIYDQFVIENKITNAIKANRLKNVLTEFNINYIAPYSFNDILKCSNSFDYICSQVVFEHMSPNQLNEMFRFIKTQLSKDGVSVHTINFIDHFTNPGLFADHSISVFNFLKYSDKTWNFWAGNSIAYTNRLSYIYYINLCQLYQLEIKTFEGQNYREITMLNEDLIHKDVLKKYNFVHFSLTFSETGAHHNLESHNLEKLYFYEKVIMSKFLDRISKNTDKISNLTETKYRNINSQNLEKGFSCKSQNL